MMQDPGIQNPEPGRNDEGRLAELLRLAGPRATVPELRLERARSTVRARWQQEVRRRRQRRWLALAATLAVAVTAPWWTGRVSLPGTEPSGGVPAPEVARIERSSGEVRVFDPEGSWRTNARALRAGEGVETGATGRVALRLAEGVSLRVDVLSAIRMESPTEIRLMRGAAYLDSDPERRGDRATILTALGEIRHLGTQFEVRLVEEALRLRVREGRASVERGGVSFEAETGVELTVDTEGLRSRGTISTHGPQWAWVQEIAPGFHLEGETLAGFLEWTARETGWTVRLEGGLQGAADGVVLHGTVEELSPEEAVRAVLPTCEVSFRLDDGELVVARP